MKLYQLKSGDKFKIITEDGYAKDSITNEDALLTFINLDGMYSVCDYHGNIEHIAAYSDVEVIE